MDERIPPHSVEVERAVLGAMLRSEEAVSAGIQYLDSTDFYRNTHARVFSAMRDLSSRSEPVDFVTVAEALESSGDLDKIGGRSAIVEIADSVFSAANIEAHCRIVRDKAILRRLVAVCRFTEDKCYSSPGDVTDLICNHEAAIHEITLGKTRDYTDSTALMLEAMATIDSYKTHGVSRVAIPTTYPRLDMLLGGFRRAELVIVAGRPSMGKTALGLNFAIRMCLNHNLSVAFFSLEMSKESLSERIITNVAHVDSLALRLGKLKPEEYTRVSEVGGKFADAKFYLDDTPAMHVYDLRARARRIQSKHGVDCVMVDYLQLLRGDGDQREQEVSFVSRSLKAMAKEMNIPVIAMSQLNRMVEGRAERRPQLADLRESGAIEQDADVVMFTNCLDRYGIQSDGAGDTKNRMDLIIAKQRNGPTGDVHLSFIRDEGRIETWSGE